MTTPEPTAPPTGLKARARALAAPMVAKARDEVVRVTADDQVALRSEVAELRAELARQQAAHDAELAAVYEELEGLRSAQQG